MFGKTYGWLLGMLDTLGIPYQAVSVQKWKKEFGLTSDKSKSVEVCRRLFPTVNLKRTDRCKKDDDKLVATNTKIIKFLVLMIGSMKFIISNVIGRLSK